MPHEGFFCRIEDNMSLLEEMRKERLKKVAILKEKGINPYPASTNRDTSVADFLAQFEVLEKKKSVVTMAGRLMTLRRHGGIVFADMFDGTERVQIMLQSGALGEQFELFEEVIDTGDFIETTGVAHTTKRGEKSLIVNEWRTLTKSLVPIPDEWFGLKDEDERFRKRYIDILLNKDVANMVRQRSKFWNVMREYLLSRDFVEVETPVLENTTGGAEARPFVTHHNALDIDVYLRISLELWQKRLMVAGIPRTFEIGRIFRNEGMSHEHLQDYTQMEFYMAYSDYKAGMKMVHDMYQHIAQEVFGTTKFTIKDSEIDLAGEWDVYDYNTIIKKHFKIDPLDTNLDAVKKILTEEKVKYDEKTINLERGVDLLWKKIRRSFTGPGFLINVPAYMEPLAKKSEDDPRVVERFQIMLAGSEMGKGYSELNDPVDQRERFLHQQSLRDAGDDEAQMADLDYIEALEYGMPPTFGFGVSERLFSFLLDKNIREAQTFPLMKSKA